MKTLYVHIGTPKTATTSLQHFCDENEKILEEQGYITKMYESNIAEKEEYAIYKIEQKFMLAESI